MSFSGTYIKRRAPNVDVKTNKLKDEIDACVGPETEMSNMFDQPMYNQTRNNCKDFAKAFILTCLGLSKEQEELVDYFWETNSETKQLGVEKIVRSIDDVKKQVRAALFHEDQ